MYKRFKGKLSGFGPKELAQAQCFTAEVRRNSADKVSAKWFNYISVSLVSLVQSFIQIPPKKILFKTHD